MERPGLPARERLGERGARPRAPASQPCRRARRDAALVRELARRALDAGLQRGHGACAGERRARRRVRGAREAREPCRAERARQRGRAEPARAEQAAEHLVLARGTRGAPDRTRAPAGLTGGGPARPEPERGLEPPAGDTQGVERVRAATGSFDHRGHALAQARGGHRRRATARHATGPGTFLARSPVTPMHNSSARSSTSRVASSVWKP